MDFMRINYYLFILLNFIFSNTYGFWNFGSNKAYKNYKNENYDAAISELISQQANRPFDFDINYNLGVTNYSKGKFEDAKKAFRLVVDNNLSKDEKLNQAALFNLARSSQQNTLSMLGEDWLNKNISDEVLNKAEAEIKDAIAYFEKFIENDLDNELANKFLKQSKDLLEAILKKKEMNKNKKNQKDNKQDQQDKNQDQQNNQNPEDKNQDSQSQNNDENQENNNQKNNENNSQDKENKPQDDKKEDKKNKNQRNNLKNEKNEKDEEQEPEEHKSNENKGEPNKDLENQKQEQENQAEQPKEDEKKDNGSSENRNKAQQEQSKDELNKKPTDQSLGILKSLLDKAEQKESKIQKKFLDRNLRSNKNSTSRW